MKFVLANLRKGPKVGFIFTQVENGDLMDHVKGPDFLPMVLKSIGQQASGGSTFLERKRYLVLETGEALGHFQLRESHGDPKFYSLIHTQEGSVL
jgi:hypothetical protein